MLILNPAAVVIGLVVTFVRCLLFSLHRRPSGPGLTNAEQLRYDFERLTKE